MDDSTLPYLDSNYKAKITKTGRLKNSSSVKIIDDYFLISFSNLDENSDHDELKKQIKNSYEDFIDQKSKEIFPFKVKHYSKIINVHPQKIVLKNLRNQWGSITQKATINLNKSLVWAPGRRYTLYYKALSLLFKNSSTFSLF